MKNLINFFFSFDKLMKEKLVLPFFWLAVIAWGMDFFATALANISLGPLASIVSFFNFFVTILLALVVIRLLAELAVAIFRINDNLSPDGGKSELANIDPMAEARKVAEAAAERAREAAKTAGEKTQAATKSARESMSTIGGGSSKNDAPLEASKAKPAPSRKTAPKNPAVKKSSGKVSTAKTASAKSKTAKSKTAKSKTATSKTKTPLKVTTKSASSAKKTNAKPSAAGPAKKRGPKAGVKVKRDAQGRLLKKDGTLRAKPGPQKK